MSELAEVRVETRKLYDLFQLIEQGRLRWLAGAQLNVWDLETRLKLLDSVDRGYPVGELLLWQTPLALASHDAVAGNALPPRPQHGPRMFILNGARRLATLYGMLRQPATPREGWRAHYLPRAEEGALRFVEQPRVGETLEMGMMLETDRFIEWMEALREQDTSASLARVRAGQRLMQRFFEHRVSVTHIEGGEPAEIRGVLLRLGEDAGPLDEALGAGVSQRAR
jgi:hypothetical protein